MQKEKVSFCADNTIENNAVGYIERLIDSEYEEKREERFEMDPLVDFNEEEWAGYIFDFTWRHLGYNPQLITIGNSYYDICTKTEGVKEAVGAFADLANVFTGLLAISKSESVKEEFDRTLKKALILDAEKERIEDAETVTLSLEEGAHAVAGSKEEKSVTKAYMKIQKVMEKEGACWKDYEEKAFAAGWINKPFLDIDINSAMMAWMKNRLINLYPELRVAYWSAVDQILEDRLFAGISGV